MTSKTTVKTALLTALVVLAGGGWLLHIRIHPVAEHSYNWIPFVTGLASILVVPLLLINRKTLNVGYVLNGMLVITGTVTMAHYSLVHWPEPATFRTVMLKTLFADILILWANFYIGKAIYNLEYHGYDPSNALKGKSLRYPNYGWWGVHLVLISTVYWLGHILWR